MSWYEFTLKRFAYYRERNYQEKESWYATRFIAHRIAISTHSKPHQSWFGKDGLEKFLPLDSKDDKPRLKISEVGRKGFKDEYSEYLKTKERKRNEFCSDN